PAPVFVLGEFPDEVALSRTRSLVLSTPLPCGHTDAEPTIQRRSNPANRFIIKTFENCVELLRRRIVRIDYAMANYKRSKRKAEGRRQKAATLPLPTAYCLLPTAY